MKKKIIFLIIFIIIIIGVVPTINFLLQDKDVQALDISNERKVDDNLNHTNQRLIKVKGKLYYDTGAVSEISARCGVMDGRITSHVDSKYIPTENNQSNFEGDYSYQQGLYGTIDVVIDGKWITFKPVNQSIDFLDSNFKIEVIKKDSQSKVEYYKQDNQTIFLVGLEEIYLIDSHNKLTLKEYIEKEQLTIDQSINYITSKIEYVTGLYDGGTTIYRDGNNKEPKISNIGFTIIRCHKGNNNFTNYNNDVYIGTKNLDKETGFCR